MNQSKTQAASAAMTEALDDLVAVPDLKIVKPVAAKKVAPKKTPAKKVAAKKAAAKPVARVPADEFLAELKRLGLGKSQAAQALGLSPSSLSEFSGHGRRRLLARDRWADAKKKLAAYAAKSLK